MRIIAGTLRGRRIICPPGISLRPTSDRLKESLFNILAPQFPGCLFLDLFAGVGSIGLEAYSRGAAEVILVEKELQSLHSIQVNMGKCGLTKEIRIMAMSAEKALQQLRSEKILFDLVFLDPPYEKADLYQETLTILGEGHILKEPGRVIAEHPARHSLEKHYGGLSRFRQHRVGDSCLSFYQ